VASPGRPRLDWLIAPVPPQRFFAEHWERQPLVVARDRPTHFDSLLSLADIDALLASGGLRAEEISVVNADSAVARGDYMRSDGTADVVRVAGLLADGATLILQQLHRRHGPLARLCRAMEQEFSMPFQTNIYLTPAGGQGFKAHYDTHDVFVLQIRGAKSWEIGQSAVELPLKGQAFTADGHAFGEVRQAFELRAGDVAYLPRGLMHRARSGPELSLHITLGALAYTWADFLLEAVSAACLDEPAARRALPIGFARPDHDPAAAKAAFAALLDHLRGGADRYFAQAHGNLVQAFLAARKLVLDGHLGEALEAGQIALDSTLAPRPDLAYRIAPAGDNVVLQGHGQELELPQAAEPALRFALAMPRFAVSALPDVLDDEGKLVLARRLVRAGFLQRDRR
jgi:ribosomal protein L16 Arg81 hydroxylase